MITRRDLITGTSTLLLAGGFAPARRGARAYAAEEIERRFEAIEAEARGRLGVAVHDTGSGLKATRRGDERFPLCSTFKWLAAAAILARVDQGKETLDRKVPIRAAEIVTYSPATEKHVGQSMTLAEICEAAITLSDNTAGNLMLEALGGAGRPQRLHT